MTLLRARRQPLRSRLVHGALALAAALVPPSACAQPGPAPVSSGQGAATSTARPSLVVLITVDQLRADYLDRFAPQLHGGIARMIRSGARFDQAHHDHGLTETAPGHATLLSGRFPRSTGITMNRVGVGDRAAPLLDYAVGDGASPRRFQGTTLFDWMRARALRTRALSVSMKDRAAILPIGRAKTDVYWYSPDGRFTTSTYYRDTLPSWVRHFNDRRVPQTWGGKRWTLLLADSAYREPDSVAVEGDGTDFVFPHVLPEDGEDAASLVRLTPFIDDIVLGFALDGVSALALGTGPQTDLLAVSLSATDVIGHRYGPDSREIHDQVLRVDRAIGVFLDSLYRLRDSSTITVVLTADHGVATIPELAGGVMPPPVRASIDTLFPALAAELRAAHVPPGAIDVDQQIVSVDRDLFRSAKVNADSVLDVFAARIRRLRGVGRVDRFSKLLADSASDPIARRWSHQFPANAPVDLVITLTPGSTWGGNPASHGSPYDYDSHVPLIFAGYGIRAGRHPERVRTVDLAATLAALLGLQPLEPIDGVPLRAALR